MSALVELYPNVGICASWTPAIAVSDLDATIGRFARTLPTASVSHCGSFARSGVAGCSSLDRRRFLLLWRIRRSLKPQTGTAQAPYVVSLGKPPRIHKTLICEGKGRPLARCSPSYALLYDFLGPVAM